MDMEGVLIDMNVRVNAERLRQLRIQRGWTQNKLAKVAKVGPRTVQRAEATGRCSLDTLARLAQALGVSIDELIVHHNRREENAQERHQPGTILPRLETANEVLGIVGSAKTYEFDYDQLHTQDEVDLVGGFLQLIQDYGELWNDLQAGQRVQATFDVQKELNNLHESGFWVFGSLVRKKVRSRAFDQVITDIWPVAVIHIARENNPAIVKGHMPTFYRQS